jgi:hypothetical protein
VKRVLFNETPYKLALGTLHDIARVGGAGAGDWGCWGLGARGGGGLGVSRRRGGPERWAPVVGGAPRRCF